MLILPLNSTYPAYSETVTLEGVRVVLAIRWNYRGQYWSMDISSAGGTLIVGGIKLVPGAEFLGPHAQKPGLPPGNMILLDTLNESGKPTRENIATRFRLCYITEAEVAALE